MKMKLVSLALLGAMLVSGTAAAVDCDPRFYVGGEVQSNNLSTNKQFATRGNNTWKVNKAGLDLVAGTRITENFGLEAGYAFLGTANYKYVNTRVTNKVKVRNAHIDAMGYLPVSSDVNLIGSVGVGRMTTKVSSKLGGLNIPQNQVMKKFSKAKTGMRVGLGAEYKIDENVSARLMARHQKGNKVIKNVNSVGLGLFYTF